MTSADKKAKILAAVASRGWWPTDVYWAEAKELEAAGLIRRNVRYTTGGNRCPVWAAA